MFVLQQLFIKSKPDWTAFTWYQDFTYSARLFMVVEMCEPIFSRPFYSRTQSVLGSICSDPRDRVYALLSIHEQGRLANEMKLEIRPNYDATVSQVYEQVAREHINNNQSIQILELCELRHENPHNLSSWVPDISRPLLATPINGTYTAGRTFPHYNCCAAETLRIRGKTMCSLQTINPFSFSSAPPTTQEIYETLLRLRPPMSIEDAYVGGGSMRNAYCDALSAGSFVDKNKRDACKAILEIMWNTNLGAAAGFIMASGRDRIYPVFYPVFTYCNNRTLCTTEQGYIVLAPKYARRGDQVCVLLGCNTTMLLRPAGNRWQVVGECYVPGLESGETLAGPLPKGYRTKMVFNESQGRWYHKFQNISNKEIISEDPRFDSSEYPEIGSIVPFQRCMKKKVAQMGKVQVRSLDDEARLAYPWREENLKERGVLLQDFYLI